MRGVVRYINEHRGMVAVLTENGFSVFELLGGDPVEVGDTVSWADDTALGGELLTNHTQGERYEVFFQNHHVHQSQLRQQLLIQ
ncbi:MAG: hypothetical protein C0434_15170 [Xanthomonadaceae bacterium]|nr:hypothetical protein [Xanthomonadaceae bacterium]